MMKSLRISVSEELQKKHTCEADRCKLAHPGHMAGREEGVHRHEMQG